MDSRRMSVDEYELIFGMKPHSKFLDYITKHVLRIATVVNMDYGTIIDRIGYDWLELLLQHNESIENYEACAIIVNILKSNKVYGER